MANGPKKACGVFIAVKDSVAFHHMHSIEDPQGRYVILIWELDQTTFTLVNLYVPNARQRKLLAPLFFTVMELMQGILIIGGDFNTVINLDMDSTTPTRRPSHSIAPLLQKYKLYAVCRYVSTVPKMTSPFCLLHIPHTLTSITFLPLKGHYKCSKHGYWYNFMVRPCSDHPGILWQALQTLPHLFGD